MTLPTSIDSNITGLAIAEEVSLKVLPDVPIWYGLEPNTYANFGATFTSVARVTINATRQQLKGTITDLTAKTGFNIDLTQRNLLRLLQGFFFADAIEKPSTQPLNGAPVVLTAITSGTITAAIGLAVFLTGHLVVIKGAGVPSNDGLTHVSVGAVAGVIDTDRVLIAEAAPPATAMAQVVGFQFTAGDIHISIVGNEVVLTSTVADFTTLNLVLGEWIFLGGDLAIHQFVTSATEAVNVGYARIASIAAHSLSFDITTFAALADADAGNAQLIQIFFGVVLRNAVTQNLFKRRSYTIERQMGNDGIAEQAEYVLGAIADQFSMNLTQAAKVAVDLTFVALDIEENDGTIGIKAGTRIGLLGESAFNTSQDIYSMRLAVIDGTLNPTALFGYASDVKLIVNNGVTPNKALGVLGGFNTSEGNFKVSGTVTAYFSSVDAVAAIKNNANVCLTTILARANAGIVFDVPLLTLGGGEAKVEKDKPIMVDLTQEAAECPNGYTFLANFFEYLPEVAMPA